jgi:hypothetical protein
MTSPILRSGGRVRRAVAALAALLIAGVAACADAPSAPALDPAAASLSKANAPGQLGRFGKSDTLARPTTATALLRTSPLAASVTVRQELTRRGGHFTVPGTGLSIQVPPGAVPDQPITITVTAVKGDVIAYEFQPHGTQFKKPLELTQDLRGTNWQKRLAARLDIGYFADSRDLDLTKKSALVREAIPTGLDAAGQRVHFDVTHFSGYMVSWGFHRGWDDADRW